MDKQKIKTAIAKASYYLQHYYSCEHEQSDVCTCGLREVKAELRKIYEEL